MENQTILGIIIIFFSIILVTFITGSIIAGLVVGLVVGSVMIVILLSINDPNTCNHDESRDFTINYTDDLNEDSSDEDIKDFIISRLETKYSGVFSLSEGDDNKLTDEMKKELIIILENSSDIDMGDNNTGSGVRFKFCCQSGEHCLI